MFYLISYLLLLATMSLFTFLLYGFDKRQAVKDEQRVTETKLHLFAFLGGWPGAFAGQKFFRHKTQKTSFQIVTWVLFLLHISIVLGTFLYLLTTSS